MGLDGNIWPGKSFDPAPTVNHINKVYYEKKIKTNKERPRSRQDTFTGSSTHGGTDMYASRRLPAVCMDNFGEIGIHVTNTAG